jgi:hypothetical protein
LDLVAVLFRSLVLSLLNLLQQVKITLDHDTLHDGADLRAMYGA